MMCKLKVLILRNDGVSFMCIVSTHMQTQCKVYSASLKRIREGILMLKRKGEWKREHYNV